MPSSRTGGQKRISSKSGALFDGIPVFSFSYKHDPFKRVQIGLMAQDVEQRYPEAVIEDDAGTKYVRYDLATLPSAVLA